MTLGTNAKVSDMNSLSKIKLAAMLCVFLPVQHALAYNPPIGIPEPPFGIDESVEMYSGASGYGNDSTAPYTHYVDNTDPNCSENNWPGTKNAPICDLFKSSSISLPAGSVVEIHGGPYYIGRDKYITASGTASQPVFIRGTDPDNMPRFEDPGESVIELGGSFLIVENLHFHTGINIKMASGSESIVLRHSEVSSDPDYWGNHGSAVSMGSSNNNVVYHNHIHDNHRGSPSNPIDMHGVNLSSGATNMWILENHIHHNSGDSFQGCHRCLPAPRFVYVGKNVMHEDRENGVDLKTIHDAIISQNTIYGYERSDTSIGDAVIFGSNGIDLAGGYGPIRAWLLFNDISQAGGRGLRIEGVKDGYVIGNIIRNVRRGIQFDIGGDSTNVKVVNNTIVNTEDGIHHSWRCGADSFSIENNLILDASLHNIIVDSCISEQIDLRNNLLWNSATAGASVDIGGTSRSGSDVDLLSDSSLVSKLASSSNNLVKAPVFARDSYEQVSNSPGVDAGILSKAYQEFEDLYGIDIRYDLKGNRRPKGAAWEIGAIETYAPDPPTNLRIEKVE
jgi:hypothetical protein